MTPIKQLLCVFALLLTVVSGTSFAQAPNGTYVAQVISGTPLPAGTQVEVNFDITDGIPTSTTRFKKPGQPWKNLDGETATYTQLGESGTWFGSNANGTMFLLYYNDSAQAWEASVLSGSNAGRVMRYLQ